LLLEKYPVPVLFGFEFFRYGVEFGRTPFYPFKISCSFLLKSAGYGVFLITRKVLDARRRGATTEAYGAIRRKEERAKATPPFGFSQGREPVERQMMP
jgi:hypothetical protein